MITPTEIADSDDGTVDGQLGQQLKSKDACQIHHCLRCQR